MGNEMVQVSNEAIQFSYHLSDVILREMTKEMMQGPNTEDAPFVLALALVRTMIALDVRVCDDEVGPVMECARLLLLPDSVHH